MQERIDTSKDTKWIIGYLWILSLMGAVFLGNEIAEATRKMDRKIANALLTNCHRELVGGTFEKGNK